MCIILLLIDDQLLTFIQPTNSHYLIHNGTTLHRNRRGLIESRNISSTENDRMDSPSSGWIDGLTGLLNGMPRRDSLDEHIRKILVPRVSGTKGNIEVRKYIIDNLQNMNFHVELDEFDDTTPIGTVRFANIIATSDPQACRQLVLACHYDSKMMNGFLGAIDSAVPCAMLLELADNFKKSFRSSGERDKDRLGLTFIFFDGEEAFVEWTATDSLYGSRNLARKWEQQPAPDQCDLKNELARIQLFVLLDLIGTSDTTFVMYNRKLRDHYNNLQQYEREFMIQNMKLSASQARSRSAFKSRYVPLDFMQDDHVPFYKRGVPVLSLLAHPFPSVWHTINDNYQAIDMPRTKRILYVLNKFLTNLDNKKE